MCATFEQKLVTFRLSVESEEKENTIKSQWGLKVKTTKLPNNNNNNNNIIININNNDSNNNNNNNNNNNSNNNNNNVIIIIIIININNNINFKNIVEEKCIINQTTSKKLPFPSIFLMKLKRKCLYPHQPSSTFVQT